MRVGSWWLLPVAVALAGTLLGLANGRRKGRIAAEADHNMPGGELVPEPLIWDVGRVEVGSSRAMTFHLKNVSPLPVQIERVYAPCLCTTASVAGTVVAPGEQLAVNLVYRGRGPYGKQQTSIIVQLRDPMQSRRRISVWAYVDGPQEAQPTLSPSSWDVGVCDGTPFDGVLVVDATNHGHRPYEILRIAGPQGADVDAELPISVPGGESRPVRIRLRSPLGTAPGQCLRLFGSGGPRRELRIMLRGLAAPSDAGGLVAAREGESDRVVLLNGLRRRCDIARVLVGSLAVNVNRRIEPGGELQLSVPSSVERVTIVRDDGRHIALPVCSNGPAVLQTADGWSGGRAQLFLGRIIAPETPSTQFAIINLGPRSVRVRGVSICDRQGRVRLEGPSAFTICPHERRVVRLCLTSRMPPGTFAIPGTIFLDDQDSSLPFAITGHLQEMTVEQAAERGATLTRLLAVSEQLGEMAPCNCATGQAGGFPRLAGLAAREGSWVCQIGDFVGDEPVVARRKLAAVLRMLGTAGPAVAVPGAQELMLGGEALSRVSAEAKVPLLACNLAFADSGKCVLLPHAVLEIGGMRVGVIGAIDARLMPATWSERSGLVLSAVLERIPRSVAELTPRCDTIVLLLYGASVAPAKIHELNPGIGAIIVGRADGHEHDEIRLPGCVIVQTAKNGKVGSRLDLAVRGGSVVASRYVGIEVGTDVSPFPAAAAVLRQYKRDLKTLPSPPLMRDVPQYAGGGSCVPCHAQAHNMWLQSKHAHAFESLVSTGDEFDPDCLRCHTVGFDRANGHRVGANPGRFGGVQCESCHGPAASHVEEPEIRTLWRPERVCADCHTPEASPQFDRDLYWSRIVHR